MHPTRSHRPRLLDQIARALTLGLLLIALLEARPLAICAPADEAAVSRTPPEAYLTRALPLLTPFDQIKATPLPSDRDAGAQVLIDENIHLVGPDGRVLRVNQIAYRVLNETGVKPLAEDLFSYARGRQKFHLVRAVAIAPDGTEQAVAPDALLVQSPQRQADLAVYDDTTEVRVIYPRIQPGSITHAITVIEDLEVRMPGTYTSRRIWGTGWPTALERWVVEMHPALAPKLRWFTLGSGVPEPVRETRPDGALRLVWRSETPAVRRTEVARAPASQTGPCLHLTTLADWDEVAAWFQSLLAGRDELPADLAAQADEWIRATPDRDALVRLLFSQVANEVRYTSIALGEGDYRPRSCADVWSRRHGDCKDKSNLLAALLRRAGIQAHLALVNTSHLGLIDRRAPDFRVFSHAIVALPDGKGGYTFCDPTIACGLPGMLGPSSADRDVLVLRDGRADWTRPAAQVAGRLDYTFDLELNPAGEISGWLTLSADGLYGAWERDRYRDLDKQGRRTALSNIVRGFFPGADVIDFVTPDAVATEAPAVVKVYFVVAGQGDAAAGPSALRFPRSSTLFLDLGDTEQRATPYFLYQDSARVVATFKLPPGASPGAMPAAFQVETPTGAAHARWIAEPGIVRAELTLDIRQPSLPPREFPRFYQAMLALESWLGQPLALRSGPAPAEASSPVASVNLPLMPTGAGQLDLIEQRYPLSGDRALRRAALQRAIQYFPNDALTACQAGVHLAILDWEEDKNQSALDRLDTLLATHRAILSKDELAWAEHIRALALRDLGRGDESIAILTRIARDSAVNAWRRAQCAIAGSAQLETRDRAAAAEVLEVCAPLVSEKQAPLLARLARLRLALDQPDALRKTLDAIAAAQPAELDVHLAHITDAARDWNTPDASALLSRWLALVRAFAPAPGQELAAALDRADAAARSLASAAEIRQRLLDAVSRPPLSTWLAADATAAAAAPSWKDYEKTRQNFIDKNDSDACVRLGVRTLVALPANNETLARLWRVAGDADWHERRSGRKLDYPVLDLLLDLCDRVPKSHDTHFEGSFIRGYRLARHGDHAAARAHFTALLADSAMPATFRISAHAHLSAACENLGDYPAALEAARPLEDHVADSDRDTDRIFRCVLLNLHLDRTAEALRLLALLENATDATLKKATNEYFIRELIELRRAGRAEAFWSAHKTWWPAWQKLSDSLRLPEPGLDSIVPVIPEVSAHGAKLRKADQAKDAAAYWREFRVVVSAARWVPSLAPELSSLRGQAARISPAQAPALNLLILALLAVPGFPDENVSLRQFHVAATHFDTGKHPEALAAIAAFHSAHPDGDAFTPAVNRLWAMTARASGRQLAEAAAALELDLADPAASVQRASTVEHLANLYRARHLTDEETRLLERELANAVILADQDAHKNLSARRDQLGGSLRLAEAVSTWLRANPVPWLEHAEPKSLRDPRLRALSTVLEKPERQFDVFETVKLRLLAAQNPDLGLAAQASNFRLAIETLHERSPSQDEALRIAESFLDNTAFDESERAMFLWHLVIDAYNQRRPADFARWHSHPLVARYNPGQTKFVNGLARSVAIDSDDPAALAAFADELIASELEELEASLLGEILGHYIRLDEFDRARALVASISTWRFAPDYDGTRESTALQFTRKLRAAEDQAPVHRALVARVRAHFDTLPAQPPAAYTRLRLTPGELPELSHADTRQAGLWLIHSRRLARQDFEPWSELVPAFYHGEDTRALSLDLVETALQSAPDDETRAAVLGELYYSVDHDEPATLARLRAIVAPYANPLEHPLCARYLRVQNLCIALRLDEPVDFEAGLRSLDSEDDGYMRAHLALRRHLQRDDLPALKRTLRGLDSGALLNQSLLSLSVPAFARAGLKAEHQLARDTAQRALRQAIVSAWATADPTLAGHALNLAETLGGPSPFPPGWVASVSERCPNPMIQGRVRLMDAWLDSDWNKASHEARELIRSYPTYYDLYWSAGAALHRAGKTTEAAPYLETYVKHAKDEIEYPAALALLGAAKK